MSPIIRHKQYYILINILLIFCGFLAPVQADEVMQVPAVTQQQKIAGLSPLPAGITLHYPNLLDMLYSAHAEQSFWQNRQAAELFQRQLMELALAGIAPQFNQWASWLADPEINATTRDKILSDALLGYISFVSGVEMHGRSWLYGLKPIQLVAPSASEIARWQQAWQRGEELAYIQGLAPQHSQYEKMNRALQRLLLEQDQQPWPKVATTPSLKVGDNSSELAMIRYMLLHNALISGDQQMLSLVEVDNTRPDTHHYSSELAEAIKLFQQWQGLEADGVIGPRTREWLNISPKRRITLLALNIQRLRLLPKHLQNGILVNIADYSLVYYKNGSLALSSRVIVGKPQRKTPMMDSSLINVVLNPPWNVPTKLIREDIVPRIKRDPGYLHRQNYVIYSNWENDSYPVDPSTIDWANISPQHFPYRIRQSPGSNNALGRYKFNMPNSEAIYLHDTPNQSLFNRDIRALSSGCVRVNKAPQLAHMLLQDVGWNDSRILSALEGGKTTYVTLRQKLPVELHYLTAWVAENGSLQYRTDIYNYDRFAKTSDQIEQQARNLLQ